MIDYYNAVNVGGAINSRGILFQDCVSIHYLFKFIDDEEFVSMTMEQLDDFSIIFNNCEMFVQVKNEQFTPTYIKNLLKDLTIKPDKINCYVSSTWNQELKNIVIKIQDFKNAKCSGRGKKEIDAIGESLKQTLDKHKLKSDIMLKVQLDEISSQHQIESAEYSIYKWLERNLHKSVDAEKLFEQVLAVISMKRSTRGSISRENIEILLKRCTKLESSPNVASKNIGSDLISVIINLELEKQRFKKYEENIELVIVNIKQNKYKDAITQLNGMIQLGKTFEKYRIWALIKNKDYILSKKESFEYLKKYGFDCDINQYIGLIYYENKEYKKAYKFFKKVYEISGKSLPYELSLYMGNTCKKLKKSSEECLEYYQYCLDIGDGDFELHYEISELVPLTKSIYHLKKAMKIDPNNYTVYLRLATLMREIGYIEEAYNFYLNYFRLIQDRKKDVLALAGIYFCLVEKGRKEESTMYLVELVRRYFEIHEEREFRENRKVIMIDINWREMKLLEGTRKGNNLIIVSPIEQLIIKDHHNRKDTKQIAIGAIPDSFLSMCEMMRVEYGTGVFEFKNALKPAIIQTYFDDIEFLKKRSEILNQNILSINKEFTECITKETLDQIKNIFPSLKVGSELQYREYIDTMNSVKVNIVDYNYYKLAKICIGESIITAEFGPDKGGYLMFLDRREVVDQSAIVLFSANRAEMIVISFSVKNIFIERNNIHIS